MAEQWNRKRTVEQATLILDPEWEQSDMDDVPIAQWRRFAHGVLRIETEMRKLENEVAALRTRVGNDNQ